MFGLFKSLRRKELRNAPFPELWNRIVDQNVHQYERLSGAERAKLRKDLRVLVAEKDWEACRGLEMTDEIRVTIAAQACLLTLGFDSDSYPDVTTILVYPTEFVAPERRERPGGVVHEFRSRRIGEAWTHGPVVISWADALAGGRGESDGRNVVLHEFAHKLDMRTGPPDGVPKLMNDAQYREWEAVMSCEFAELVSRSHAGDSTLLDTYGATHAAEFFACATECFFERPVEMREQHPRLYGALQGYYRQDTATRYA
jgi:Mlc titration factor MtfA (ptsG expression regulator)